MKSTLTLIQHRDIQNWVTARHGMPAIARIPSGSGQIQARLALSFAKPRARPTIPPGMDDDLSPVSWNAWLAELDRQNLALRVTNQKEFEFIERQHMVTRNFSDTMN